MIRKLNMYILVEFNIVLNIKIQFNVMLCIYLILNIEDRF